MKPMLVMVANNSGQLVRTWAQRFPGQVGHLYSPGGERGPFPELPYALDNGRFCLMNGIEWDCSRYLRMLEWAAEKPIKPLWALVPDVPANADATRRDWDKWAPHLERFGWPLAMAVQDGMYPHDVPRGVVCFMGGTMTWKLRNLERFTAECARIHVGRINRLKLLWECQKLGVESVDGTGWMRGDQRQRKRLEFFLARTQARQFDLQMMFHGMEDANAS